MELKAVSLLGTCGHVDETDKNEDAGWTKTVLPELQGMPRLIAETICDDLLNFFCRGVTSKTFFKTRSSGLWGNKSILKFINMFISFNLS